MQKKIICHANVGKRTAKARFALLLNYQKNITEQETDIDDDENDNL